MQLVAIFAVIEIIVTGMLLQTSPSSELSHNIKDVLGIKYLAQETTTPIDTSTSPDADNSSETNQSISTPTDIPQPTESSDTPTPTDSPTISTIPPQDISPSPIDQLDTAIPTSGPTIEEISNTPDSAQQPTDTPTQMLLTVTPIPTPMFTRSIISSDAYQALFNSDQSINNPDQISQSSITNAEEQDRVIQNIQDPTQKTQQVIAYIHEDGKNNANTTSNGNNFTTTSYLTQRLDHQISNGIEALKTVPAEQYDAVKDSFKKACQDIDSSLRTQQLLVSEDLEQDIEIARGKCASIQ